MKRRIVTWGKLRPAEKPRCAGQNGAAAATTVYFLSPQPRLRRTDRQWLRLPVFEGAPDHAAEQRHHDEHEAKGANDGRAGGEVDFQRQVDAERRDQGAHSPADRQAGADAFGVQHGAYRGNDQVAEHQQHAGNRNGRRDDEPERSIEKKIPEAYGVTVVSGMAVVERDGQELFAKYIVKKT